jgi:hypothetical protein
MPPDNRPRPFGVAVERVSMRPLAAKKVLQRIACVVVQVLLFASTAILLQ